MSATAAAPQHERSESSAPRWSHSPAVIAGAATALLLGALGLIVGRVDVALLCLPLVASLALSLRRLPRPGARSGVRLTQRVGGPARVDCTLSIQAPAQVEMVVLRYSVLGERERELVLAGPLTGELTWPVPLLHSGPQELLRVEHRLLAADTLLATAPQEPIVAEHVAAPAQRAVGSLPLPRRLQGLTGPHESARAGDGGEFRDVHPFTAGDRLRRIDWKATARRGRVAGELYVRRTNALADATVLIVMDSRDDVGEQVAQWSRNDPAQKGISSLDIAREAAGSLAAAYIAAGDRVGFQDLSSRARMITHAAGARHLARLQRAVQTTAPGARFSGQQRPPIVPPGALVYLLSSLLDDQSVNLALRWLADGHRVIAVDVLPAARFARTTRHQRIAHRMVLMEREERIELLRRRGVELLRWSEEHGSLPLAARLRLLSRPARRLGAGGVGR